MTPPEFLASAADTPVQLTVSELLAIWGFRYRNLDSTARIHADLRAAGLACEPDLADGSMQSRITIGRPETAPSEPADCGPTVSDADADADAEEQVRLPHATIRVRDIRSATDGVKSIPPGTTLQQAQHIMIEFGYSQLAVTTGPQELRGAVSWETIAKARLANDAPTLDDALDRYPKVVHADQELLGQLGDIYAADFVFVKENDDSICGIVTNADLNSQFGELITPFVQLGEIERRLRPRIGQEFTVEELRAAANDKRITSAENMMFGHYCMLLKDPDRWKRMHWGLDHQMFWEQLDEVRKIRNKVMHFDAGPLQAADRARLMSFLAIMRHLSPST
jgi:CBS domain-containing protein